jgi:hypothetical protein
MKNLKQLAQDSLLILLGIFALYIAWITGTGEILNHIHFADPLNEMFFCMASLSMGVGCIIAGFSKA